MLSLYSTNFHPRSYTQKPEITLETIKILISEHESINLIAFTTITDDNGAKFIDLIPPTIDMKIKIILRDIMTANFLYHIEATLANQMVPRTILAFSTSKPQPL